MTLPKEKTPLYYALFTLSVLIPLISSSFGWLGLIPLAVAIFLMRDEYSELDHRHKDLVETVKVFREDTGAQIDSLSQTSKSLADSLKALDLKISSSSPSVATERVIERIKEERSFMPLTYATLALMCLAGFLAYRSSRSEINDALVAITKTNTKVASLESHLSTTNIRVSESITKLRETIDNHVEKLQVLKAKLDGERQEKAVAPATSPVIRRRGNNAENEPQAKTISVPDSRDRARLEIAPTAASSHSFQSFKVE